MFNYGLTSLVEMLYLVETMLVGHMALGQMSLVQMSLVQMSST